MNWRLMLQPSTRFACMEPGVSVGVLVGVPMDYTSTYKPGSRFAPDSVRNAACNIEFYSLATGRLMENEGLIDLGNIVLPPGDVEGSLRIIGDVVKGVVDEYPGMLLGFLGGEHLITYPIVKALKSSVDTLVVFDAHLDMRGEYLGSRVNHASFLRRLVEDGVRVIHIGSRAYSGDELEFLKKTRDVTVYSILEALKGPLALGDLGKTYISIDMDVLEPSYAPGVGNPEPFGLTPLHLLELLKRIVEASSRVIGFDIVEVNPLVDVNDVTSIMAGKLVFELAALAGSARTR
ncbi:agmatinase [Desulfurococcus mucosus]|uniref:Agmatinase n=2 Tax=Desulfurococcus mucosus TaxID=2275 RepID=E8R7Q1_DESM0|nr:agmatinase [Desulfurococcus mucosus]ADV64546.1 agmatinase [Desulfurococcus mucosus DSM 2162]